MCAETNSHHQKRVFLVERRLVIINIIDLPQCETSITHDAVPITVILKIESLQRNGTLWQPLEIWRCKKVSFKNITLITLQSGLSLIHPKSLSGENCGGD